MKVLKDKVYFHYCIDIDGLIVDLISLEVATSELKEHHDLESFFDYLIKNDYIPNNPVRLMTELESKLIGFSTVEGSVQIDIKKYL